MTNVYAIFAFGFYYATKKELKHIRPHARYHYDCDKRKKAHHKATAICVGASK